MPDAPPPPDTPDVDASTMGLVSLQILEGTMPRVGIRVVFQNADSTVVSDTTTGTDGKATATMDPGGYVTAFDPFSGLGKGVQVTDIRTFAGVKPGDQLRLFERGFDAMSINVDFTIPTDLNAAEYRVSTNCMFQMPMQPPTATLSMSGCPPTANLLVEALDGATLPILAIYKPSVTLTDLGTVDVSADTYVAVPDVTFNYTNVPAAFTNVGVFGEIKTAVGSIRDYTNVTDVSAGSGSMTIKIPTIPNATAVNLTTLYGSTYTQHLVADWGPTATTYTLDPTGLLLPDFDGIATLDVAAHAIKWTATGGSVQPDLVNVRAFLNRDVGGSTQSWQWELVAPGGTQAVLPVLPDSSPFNPMTGDFGSYDVRIAKVPGGYDTVRANVMALESFNDFAVGPTGRAQFALLVEPSLRVRPKQTAAVRGFTRRWR